MRRFVFSAAGHVTSYEQRLGAFQMRCTACGQEVWQLLFRMYQVRGHNVMHAPPINERFQVRCSSCAFASMVQPPATWVPSLGVPFHPEPYPPTAATPAYATLAFGSLGA